MNLIRPYDIVVDNTDNIYSVIDIVECEESIICKIKYVPYSKFGIKVLGRLWVYNQTQYSKIAFEDQESTIQSPHKLSHPALGITLFHLDQSIVKHHFSAKRKAKEIFEHGPFVDDKILNDAFNILHYFCNLGLGSIDDYGITGSILLGGHIQNFSDIDLVIYGHDVMRLVISQLSNMDSCSIHGINMEIHNTSDKILHDDNLKKILKLDINDYLQLQKYRVNKGVINNTPFSLFGHDSKISPRYSSIIHNSANMVECIIEVLDDSGSYLFPSTCCVKILQVLNDPSKSLLSIPPEAKFIVENWSNWYIGTMYNGIIYEIAGAFFNSSDFDKIIVTTFNGYIKRRLSNEKE